MASHPLSSLRGCFLCGVVFAAASSSHAAFAEGAKEIGGTGGNPLMVQLLAKGIDCGGKNFLLAPPLVNAGMTAELQLDAVRKLAKLKSPADERSPDEILAKDWFATSGTLAHYRVVESLGEVAEGQAIKIETAFAVQASLESFHKKDLFAKLIGGTRGTTLPAGAPPRESRDLTPEELNRLKRKLVAEEKRKQGLHYFASDIDASVFLSGVVESFWDESPGCSSLAIAWDPSIDAADSLAPSWRRIDAGTLGKPRPYAGFAGYAVATELKGRPGFLLIELRAIYFEPSTWKGGSALRTRIRSVIESNIKDFRLALRTSTSAK